MEGKATRRDTAGQRARRRRIRGVTAVGVGLTICLLLLVTLAIGVVPASAALLPEDASLFSNSTDAGSPAGGGLD
jgi:hypothetical protein